MFLIVRQQKFAIISYVDQINQMRHMCAMKFASAYDQLPALDRDFVDGFIKRLEIDAERRFERLTATLERFSRSIDFDTLDQRQRDFFAKPLTQAAIRERVEKLASERDLTPARIIQEHAAIALANMRDYVELDEDGIPEINLNDCSRIDWSAIHQIESEETYGPKGTTRKIKLRLYNKQASLDALAKWNGLDKADNAEYVAYKSLPPELTQIPSNVSIEKIADQYAQLLTVNAK